MDTTMTEMQKMDRVHEDRMRICRNEVPVEIYMDDEFVLEDVINVLEQDVEDEMYTIIAFYNERVTGDAYPTFLDEWEEKMLKEYEHEYYDNEATNTLYECAENIAIMKKKIEELNRLVEE